MEPTRWLAFAAVVGVFVLAVLTLCALDFAAAPEAGPTSAIPYVVVDTGQELCYDDAGRIILPEQGTPFYGQDAQYHGVQFAFCDNGDGTITDNNTGLVWQKTPDYVRRNWSDAKHYAEQLTLANHDDWRLPSIKELMSIADFSGSILTRTPYINTRYFDFAYPDTSAGFRIIDAQYWSSTGYVGITMGRDRSAFGFNFADAHIKAYPVWASLFVRCVRGGRGYGENHFVDNGDGTVTDQATGLMWQKADDGVPRTWQQALAYAEALVLAGYDDWRLPNAKELQSIVDYTRNDPAIDPVFTIRDPDGWFWSSTTHGDNPRMAVYVAFGKAMSVHGFDAHGAGAMRSDPKSGDPAQWAYGLGPQADEVRIYNYVRAVRTASLRP